MGIETKSASFQNVHSKHASSDVGIEHVNMWLYNLKLLKEADHELFENFCIAIKRSGDITGMMLHPYTVRIAEEFKNSEELQKVLQLCSQDEYAARLFLKNFGFLDSCLELKDTWRRFILEAVELLPDGIRLKTYCEIGKGRVSGNILEFQTTKSA